jgi:cytochrome c oxidase assembly factor CtaG
MSVSAILGDAFELYRLLFRRSVATAAVVYAVLHVAGYLAERPADATLSFVLGLVAFVLGFAGPVLVQGALVQIVRNVRDGTRPESMRAILSSAGGRAHSLVGASIVYSFGVGIGLLLLVVPGLLAAARWCLMAPLIMLEDADAREARHASSTMVRGKTWTVLGAVVVAFLLITLVPAAVSLEHGFDSYGFEYALFDLAWSSVTAPLYAHVLTVIYYKLVDPERPIIHLDVKTWRSVWAGR